MDYFVLLIHQGIIGFILMFSAYIVLILNIVKEYFTKLSAGNGAVREVLKSL